MNELKSGFLLINKPCGITSHTCINHLRKIIQQKKIKIGHAGTLDPFASGLLIIAIGRDSTRLISHFMALEKTYIAQAKLGELTETLDHTGTTLETKDCEHITEQNIQQALHSFGSAYEQTPPLYSALKHKGTPLYKLTRQKNISPHELHSIAENKKKIVQLYQLKLLSFNPPFFTIQTQVSQGTYIRSLLNDIALKMNTYATTYALERTAIGPYSVSNAISLSSIQTIDDINAALIIK